jgi:acyl carrier protein
MGLDTVELVMEIEEAFDISIPDDRASKMLTVGDVYEFILEKTTDATLQSSASLTAADVWNSLQLIVAEQLGVDRSIVVPHARFVQDLGAD